MTVRLCDRVTVAAPGGRRDEDGAAGAPREVRGADKPTDLQRLHTVARPCRLRVGCLPLQRVLGRAPATKKIM
eukprot:8942189-Pyramimonas_sp.AAC.1